MRIKNPLARRTLMVDLMQHGVNSLLVFKYSHKFRILMANNQSLSNIILTHLGVVTESDDSEFVEECDC